MIAAFSLSALPLAFLPQINLFEMLLMLVISLGFFGLVGAVIYTAVRVSRLQPMECCPHCGAKLRDK